MSIMTNEQKAEMASDTWERIADERLVEIVRLKTEVARLKGLIKDTSNDRGSVVCQWCNGDGHGRHRANCPAFTPDGVVR